MLPQAKFSLRRGRDSVGNHSQRFSSRQSSGNVQTLRFQVYRKWRPTSTLQVCSTRSRIQLKMVIEYGKRGFSRDFAQPNFAKLSCQMRGDGKGAKLHKAMSKGSLCEPLFCPPAEYYYEAMGNGHRVMTVSPRYDQYEDAWHTNTPIEITIGDRTETLFLAKVWGKTGSNIYGPSSGEDYDDNQFRFILLAKAAVEATRVLNWDINDFFSGAYEVFGREEILWSLVSCSREILQCRDSVLCHDMTVPYTT